MPDSSANEAAKPNPALESYGVLIGTWTTVGTHPLVPGKTFHGQATFEWFEGGAFLIMRTRIDEPEIPSGIAIFGTDDAAGACTMVYFDERGVSRHYQAGADGNVIRWWRDDPAFSQRWVMTVDPSGNAMTGRGEMSRDGGSWEPDLELTYTRTS